MSVKHRTSLYTPARGAGADQLAKWKATAAALKRQQRQQRGRRRKQDASDFRPGMARILPASQPQATDSEAK